MLLRPTACAVDGDRASPSQRCAPLHTCSRAAVECKWRAFSTATGGFRVAGRCRAFGSGLLTREAFLARPRSQQSCRRRTLTARVELSSASTPAAEGAPARDGGKGLAQGLGAVAVGLLGAALVWQSGYAPVIKEKATNSVLGRSGFLAAFALIFLSELGDKTFFIAGLLAMKVGKWVSFVGSTAALAVMTLISVAIGYGFKSVPDALKTSAPVGSYLGAACLVYFGIKTLRDAWAAPEPVETGGGGELASAQDSLSEAESKGQISAASWWQSLVTVATLIFLAEWGDRSMLATVALGAANSPIGVAAGAILGHALATVIAVLSGAFASQYISEKTVGYIGGTLFLFFAAATLLGYF